MTIFNHLLKYALLALLFNRLNHLPIPKRFLASTTLFCLQTYLYYQPPPDSPYKLLNVKLHHGPKRIYSALREARVKWHPDRNPSAQATLMSQKLERAKDVLKNDELRNFYNRYGDHWSIETLESLTSAGSGHGPFVKMIALEVCRDIFQHLLIAIFFALIVSRPSLLHLKRSFTMIMTLHFISLALRFDNLGPSPRDLELYETLNGRYQRLQLNWLSWITPFEKARFISLTVPAFLTFGEEVAVWYQRILDYLEEFGRSEQGLNPLKYEDPAYILDQDPSGSHSLISDALIIPSMLAAKEYLVRIMHFRDKLLGPKGAAILEGPMNRFYDRVNRNLRTVEYGVNESSKPFVKMRRVLLRLVNGDLASRTLVISRCRERGDLRSAFAPMKEILAKYEVRKESSPKKSGRALNAVLAYIVIFYSLNWLISWS